jgi:uroporphyrin-III C-methyltransferase/precorrin-2 dehydrogenase/sirohydrochlorin ferrochelatase
MDYLPLFFDLRAAPCLVVGGGDIAARKAQLLCKAQARVTLVSPALSATAQKLVDADTVVWIEAVFLSEHLKGQRLVIAATDKREVNQQVYDAAKLVNIPINVADCPELCDFILPSILDRSPILVAVSSGGKSPILARQLRARLETLIPPSYGRLATLVGNYRDKVKAVLPTVDLRRRFWDGVLQGSVAEQIHAGRDGLAQATLDKALANTTAETLQHGEVYLVGAGPGAPELLTFKALRLMQQADVVFYDRLVSPAILDLVRKEADQVYVGKQRDWHSVRQEGINQLLVEHAQAGMRVLRLKGGDPFIFGRGGEEIETLAAKGIPFQVVPGITAASGCASYAGIPLTHRDHAQSCTFVTGQLKEGELDLNWSMLVQPRQTIVVYMGLAGLSVLSAQLQAHGLTGNTPAALIQQGTTEQQKVWVSTIAELPAIAEQEQPVAPTLVVIGSVVALHDSLAWFQAG